MERAGRAVLAMVCALSALLAGCGTVVGTQTPLVIEVTPGNGARGVEADDELRVSVPDGGLERVRVTRKSRGAAHRLPGRLSSDGRTWRPTAPGRKLKLGSRYTVDVVAQDERRPALRAAHHVHHQGTAEPLHRLLHTRAPADRRHRHDPLDQVQPSDHGAGGRGARHPRHRRTRRCGSLRTGSATPASTSVPGSSGSRAPASPLDLRLRGVRGAPSVLRRAAQERSLHGRPRPAQRGGRRAPHHDRAAERRDRRPGAGHGGFGEEPTYNG